MDILSHALLGKVITARKQSRKIMWTGIIFSVLPDLTQVPLYLAVGSFADRSMWIPHLVDWVGFRAAHPVWSMLWEIPHSFLFLGLIVVPLVLWFKIPKVAIPAYGLHIFIDLFSHTGEWSVKPFYPFNYTVSGFTDGWAWSLWGMVASWIVLALIAFIISKWFSKKTS